jgi:hypothetical protein
MSDKEFVFNQITGAGLTSAADTAADVATAELDGNGMPLPPQVPDTAATRAVWAILCEVSGTTTVADLADAAGVNRSTVSKILVALEVAGAAVRTSGVQDGARRMPDLWRLAEQPSDLASLKEKDDESWASVATEQPEVKPDDEVAVPIPAPAGEGITVVEEEGASKPSPAPENESGKSRLGSGKLREMVLSHLREHPNEELSPTAIGKALARSAGAISNALDKMVDTEEVIQTNEKPRKFRYKGEGG